MTMYLVKLKSFDDTYAKTYMAEGMLNTPEMKKLSAKARDSGFYIEVERLEEMEDLERFLEMEPI